jgi:hypothetical protein
MRQVGVALALGVVLTACGSETRQPPSVPELPGDRPTSEAAGSSGSRDPRSESAHAFEGSGVLATEAFALGGGSYGIEWSATSLPGYPCLHQVVLENDTGYSDLILDIWFGADEPIYDTTYRLGLPQGTYHFEVNSACDWTLAIAEAEVEGPSW